jgi:hypothetical protein
MYHLSTAQLALIVRALEAYSDSDPDAATLAKDLKAQLRSQVYVLAGQDDSEDPLR